MDVLTGNMMESNGQPGKVNVSAILRDFLLKHFPGFVVVVDSAAMRSSLRRFPVARIEDPASCCFS